MIPSAWPVKTRGPPAGECRKSNARPRSVSWSTRDSTGRLSASSDDTRRRLADSRRPHNTPFSGTERSGMVRSSRQAMQNRRGLPSVSRSSINQLQADGDSRFAQRTIFSGLAPSMASSQVSGSDPVTNGNTCRRWGSITERSSAGQANAIAEENRPSAAAEIGAAGRYRRRFFFGANLSNTDCMGMLIVRNRTSETRATAY